jgi:hypothetical protein
LHIQVPSAEIGRNGEHCHFCTCGSAIYFARILHFPKVNS